VDVARKPSSRRHRPRSGRRSRPSRCPEAHPGVPPAASRHGSVLPADCPWWVLTDREQGHARIGDVVALLGEGAPIWANWTSMAAEHSAVWPRRRQTAGAWPSRGSGGGDARRMTPGRRPIPAGPNAMSPRCCPHSPWPTPWRHRTSSAERTKRRVLLAPNPWAGSSCMAITSVAGHEVQSAGLAHQVGRPDEDDRDPVLLSSPPGARHDLARRLVATMASTRRGEWPRARSGRDLGLIRSVDLDGLAPLVPPHSSGRPRGAPWPDGSAGTCCGPVARAASWQPGGCGPWPLRSLVFGTAMSDLQVGDARRQS